MRKPATYEGVVENGHVTLPPNADIPDNTRVYVLVPDVESQRPPRIASPRLVHPEQAKDFELQIVEDTTGVSRTNPQRSFPCGQLAKRHLG